MTPEARALIKAGAAAVVAIALVLAGIAIGANLAPRVVKVERTVARDANPFSRPATALRGAADVVEGACGAIVSFGGDASPPAPATSQPRGRRRHTAPPPSDRPVGFFITPDGAILTPASSLPSGSLAIQLNDGRRLPAERVGVDENWNLALLKVQGANLPYLKFADDGFPRVGDAAVGIAAPNGSGCIAQSAFVTADFLAEQPVLQAYVRTAPTPDPALPGMPFVNGDGLVIGIAGLGDDESTLLPAQAASRIGTMLLRGSSPPEEAAGLLADNLPAALAARLGADPGAGALVVAVKPKSRADRGGLKAGDVVIAAGDAPVSGVSELGRALDTLPGDIALDVLRQHRQIRLSLPGNL